jgi:hypothetical protein
MRLAGCAILAVLAGGCASPSGTARNAADQGYLLGQSDAVKQLYWAKQALEAPGRGGPDGKTEYYTWVESGTTPDGRRLAPQTVSVPVFVPAPSP